MCYLALCDSLQGPDELYPGALVWRLGNVGHALPDKGLDSLRNMPYIGFASGQACKIKGYACTWLSGHLEGHLRVQRYTAGDGRPEH